MRIVIDLVEWELLNDCANSPKWQTNGEQEVKGGQVAVKVSQIPRCRWKLWGLVGDASDTTGIVMLLRQSERAESNDT